MWTTRSFGPANARRLLAALSVWVVAFAGAPGPARADGPGLSSSRSSLQDQYDPQLLSGFMGLRAPADVGGGHLVGDNTDANGLRWTKCTNFGIDLLVTLAAEAKGLVSPAEARAHVGGVVDVLSGLATFAGIFPEVIRLDPNDVHAEEVDGRVRYSSIDSAWVTVALSLVDASYQGVDDALAAKARLLVAKQDYSVFVDPNGTMSAGFVVEARTRQRGESFPFSYDDLNSEARPLVNALVGLGKLPISAWNGMRYRWVRKEGRILARGWNYSAFVEMTGQLFLDETSLAPRSLGRSHSAYIEATMAVARRNGHAVFGYAPACDPVHGYSEYGLNRPTLVSPYAAAELATTGNPGALANLERVLRAVPPDGHPAPDGLEPKSGQVLCRVARALDQGLLFLSLNVDTVWRLARRASWYADAERRIADLDRTARPPVDAPVDARNDGEPQPGSATKGFAPGALSPDDRAAAMSRGRAVLRSLLDAVRAAQRTPGGRASAADARRQVAVAKAAATWMDLLPHASMVVTREEDVRSADPQFRLDLQMQAVWSPGKIGAGAAADRAVAQALAASFREEHDVVADALDAYARLYLAERRITRLREHEESLRALTRELGPPGTSAGGDAALLESRLAAIAAKEADAEASRREQAAHLESLAGQKLEGSGLDPRLELPDVLDVLALSVPGSGTGVEEATAALRHQRSMLGAAESRMPYVPELLASVLDVVVKPAPTVLAERPTWSTDQVLGQATLGFDLRSNRVAQRDAEETAVEAQEWRLEETIDESRRIRAEAAARRVGALSAWSLSRDALESQARFVDAARRFARGEVDGATLVGASANLVSASDFVDALTAEAVSAEVVLTTHAETAAAPPTRAGDPLLAPGERPAGEGGAAPRPDASVAAAEADAASAYERAEAARSTFAGRIELGVLYPFLSGSGAAIAGNTGLLLTNGGALLPPQLRHPAVLARVSLFARRDDREGRAARVEAELRAAQAVFAHKRRLARQAAARLELAYRGALLREAERRLAFVTTVRDSLGEMKREGLIDEETLASEGEMRVAVALADRETDQAAWTQAEIGARALVDGAAALGQVESREAERAARDVYESERLVGFEAELRGRIAELETDSARASLASVRAAGAAVDVAVQGTREIGRDTVGSSIGLGLNWNLDPPRTASDISDRAAAVGRAEEGLAATRTALETEKRLAAADCDETAHIRDVELQNRDRLKGVLAHLREEQAAEPELSDSAKLRAATGVEALLFDAERRLLLVESREGRALLRAMNLGVAIHPEEGAAMRSRPPPAKTLAEAIERFVESDPRVLEADAAARSIAAAAPAGPVAASGLHVVGPSFGITFSTQPGPATGTTTNPGGAPSRGLTGDIGVGLSLALGESLSFVETSARERFARTSRRAARMHATVSAIAAVAAAWNARERTRLEPAREAARAKTVLLTSPRLSAGQVGPNALAGAESAHAASQADVLEAKAMAERSRLLWSQRNIEPSDGVLDEFGRIASADPGVALENALTAVASSQPTADVVAARTRADLAWARVGSASLRLLDPITFFAEFEPFGEWESPSDAGFGPPTRDARVDLALRLGLNLQAAGEIAERVAIASARQEEVRLAERAARNAVAERRARADARSGSWRASAHALDASRRAFEETDRRYRAGESGASIDRRSEVLDALFDAERVELDARLAFLDALVDGQLQSEPHETALSSLSTASSNRKYTTGREPKP